MAGFSQQTMALTAGRQNVTDAAVVLQRWEKQPPQDVSSIDQASVG